MYNNIFSINKSKYHWFFIFIPESVSEGSFLYFGHHYFAIIIFGPSLLRHHYIALPNCLILWPSVFPLQVSSSSLFCPLQFFITCGCRRACLIAKVTITNMVWRTCVSQSILFITPARGLIQKQQVLIWFGEHVFPKVYFL